MMKLIITVIALALIGIGVYGVMASSQSNEAERPPVVVEPEEMGEIEIVTFESQEGDVVFEDGEYRVRTDESVVRWAGKKPLLSGYIDLFPNSPFCYNRSI